MKEMIKYAGVLGIICFLSAAVLAGVNALTQPAIASQKQAQGNAAFKEVLPLAVGYSPVKDGDTVLFFDGYDASKKMAGFVFTCKAKGYSSTIEVLVGVGTDLKIVAIKVLSQDETPGLGTRVAEPLFLSQFAGKGEDTLQGVSTIAGATISSSAVLAAVREGLAARVGRMRQEKEHAR